MKANRIEVLTRVMKRAWAIKKKDSLNVWSLCLKMAWAEEKECKLAPRKLITIEPWIWKYVEKEANNGYFVEWHKIVAEKEYSVLVNVTWGWHSTLTKRMNIWISKKAVHRFNNIAEVEDFEKEYYAKQQAFQDKKMERYNKMIAFAKANGVKGVRVGLKKETVLKKIEAAGLEYVY